MNSVVFDRAILLVYSIDSAQMRFGAVCPNVVSIKLDEIVIIPILTMKIKSKAFVHLIPDYSNAIILVEMVCMIQCD